MADVPFSLTRMLSETLAEKARLQEENDRLRGLVFDLSTKLQASLRGLTVEVPDYSSYVKSVKNPVIDQPFESEGHNNPYVLLSEPPLHEGAVYCVQFSPDGNFFATGSVDSKVALYSIGEMKAVFTKQHHSSSVADLTWCLDGRSFVSGSYDNTLAMWDVERKEKETSWSVNGCVLAVRHSQTDEKVFFASDSQRNVYCIDRRQPKPSVLAQTLTVVNSISAAEDAFLTGDVAGSVKVWDLRLINAAKATFDETAYVCHRLNVCNDPISSVHLNSEAGLLFVASYDNSLRWFQSQRLHTVTDSQWTCKEQEKLFGPKFKNYPIRCSSMICATPQPAVPLATYTCTTSRTGAPASRSSCHTKTSRTASASARAVTSWCPVGRRACGCGAPVPSSPRCSLRSDPVTDPMRGRWSDAVFGGWSDAVTDLMTSLTKSLI